MTPFLANKKILFITTQFYGYEKAIIQGLRDHGAEVKVFFDDPVSYTRLKFLKSSISRDMRTKVNRFYRGYLINKTIHLHFDYIFVLKGSIMSEPFLETLHRQHPGALFISYQWDSLTNFPYERFVRFFDVTFTFDPADAERVPALTYLPTFALDEFFELATRRHKVKQSIDVSFVGSNHSNRLQMLRGLRLKLKKHKLTHRFYVYLPLIVGLKSVLLTRRMKPNEFTMGPLSRKKYKSTLLRSRFVLDLPSPKQSGVSLRTYEALASGCGLITTSKEIAQERFYNDQHIFIVDPENLKEKVPALLKQDYVSTQLLDFNEYSLSSWIRKVFTIAESKRKIEALAEERQGK